MAATVEVTLDLGVVSAAVASGGDGVQFTLAGAGSSSSRVSLLGRCQSLVAQPADVFELSVGAGARAVAFFWVNADLVMLRVDEDTGALGAPTTVATLGALGQDLNIEVGGGNAWPASGADTVFEKLEVLDSLIGRGSLVVAHRQHHDMLLARAVSLQAIAAHVHKFVDCHSRGKPAKPVDVSAVETWAPFRAQLPRGAAVQDASVDTLSVQCWSAAGASVQGAFSFRVGVAFADGSSGGFLCVCAEQAVVACMDELKEGAICKPLSQVVLGRPALPGVEVCYRPTQGGTGTAMEALDGLSLAAACEVCFRDLSTTPTTPSATLAPLQHVLFAALISGRAPLVATALTKKIEGDLRAGRSRVSFAVGDAAAVHRWASALFKTLQERELNAAVESVARCLAVQHTPGTHADVPSVPELRTLLRRLAVQLSGLAAIMDALLARKEAELALDHVVLRAGGGQLLPIRQLLLEMREVADTVRVLDMVLDFRACVHFDGLAASADPQGSSDVSLLEAEYEQRRSAAMPSFPGMEGVVSGPFLESMWEVLPREARPAEMASLPFRAPGAGAPSISSHVPIAAAVTALLLYPLRCLTAARAHSLEDQEKYCRGAQMLVCCSLLDCMLVSPSVMARLLTPARLVSVAEEFALRFWGSTSSRSAFRRATMVVWLVDSGVAHPIAADVWSTAQSSVAADFGLQMAVRLVETGHHALAAGLLEHDDSAASVPLYALCLLMSQSTDWDEAWHIASRRSKQKEICPTEESQISLRKTVAELTCAWVWRAGSDAMEKLLTMPLPDVEERTLQDFVARQAEASAAAPTWRDVNLLVSMYLHRGDVEGARDVHDSHVKHLLKHDPAAMDSENIGLRDSLVSKYERALS